jgi:hypothetical protein
MAEQQKSHRVPKRLLAFSFAVLALYVASPASHAQKVRYGQPLAHAKAGVAYPIHAHISTVRYRNEYTGGKGLGLYPGDRETEPVAYMDATLDGHNVELQSYLPSKNFSIPPGEYQARLVKPDKAGKSGSSLFGEYEILMPDHTVWRCTVSGVSG